VALRPRLAAGLPFRGRPHGTLFTEALRGSHRYIERKPFRQPGYLRQAEVQGLCAPASRRVCLFVGEEKFTLQVGCCATRTRP